MPDISLDKQRIEQAINATKLLCIMSIFAFASFAAIDPYLVSESLIPLYTTRFIHICGGLIILGFCHFPSMAARANTLSAAICIWTGMGVVTLTEQTGGSTSWYWTMVMLTFFTTSLLAPFRPFQAAITYATVALYYDGWLLYKESSRDTESWVVSNAGIWLSLIVSVWAVSFINSLRDKENANRERLEKLNEKLRTEMLEREKAENDLRRTQQLDIVGQLAAGMAHELNNLLLIINCSAESIQQQDNKSKEVFRILDSSKKGSKLTSDLLLFARKNHRENLHFSVNSMVEGVAEIFSQTHNGNIDILTYLCGKNPWIKGDKQLISQALLNLGLNGIDAIERSGTLKIVTHSTEEHVIIEVIDNGKGMTKDVLEKAFEPFYTTKPPGKGTGLGLSMVYGTIKDHQGLIELRSVYGDGTQVIIKLPRIKSEPQVDSHP